MYNQSIPQRYADTGDDYPEKCRDTTNAIKKFFPQLSIVESFQSQFGKEQWLKPSTIESLQKLVKAGSKHVFIAAPSFTADCLETLEELEKENAEIFHNAGGQSYHYIPAVNDDTLFIDCLEALVRKYM